MDVKAITLQLLFNQIRTDGGTQLREKLVPERIAEYAEEIRGGAKFPPVVVFNDGDDRWLADGYYRLHAAKAVGVQYVEAEQHIGTRRDALLYSIGANSTHGLPRTNADKRLAVNALLDDAEWAKWSDHEIAQRAHVSPRFVSSVRSTRSSENGAQMMTTRRVKRGGKTYVLNTSKIAAANRSGRSRKAEPDNASAELRRPEGEPASFRFYVKDPATFATCVAVLQRFGRETDEAAADAFVRLCAAADAYGLVPLREVPSQNAPVAVAQPA